MTLHFSGSTSNAQLFSDACVVSNENHAPALWTTWVQKDLDLGSVRMMIVDDEPVVLNVLRRCLRDFGCDNIIICSDSTKALQLAKDMQPDLLLLDLLMPGMSGLEVLTAIRNEEQFKLLPVLIMTASTDPETKILSLLSGATDHLTKPLEMTDVLPRVRTALLFKRQHDESQSRIQCLEQQSDDLENQVGQRTQELIAAWQEAFECLARAAEFRDDDTGQHVFRVGRYVGIVARQLGVRGVDVDVLERAAQLHDVGKIGISDTILLKPGKLTPEEFETVKQHCEFGRRILTHMDRQGRTHGEVNSPVMHLAAIIAETHHEWWDGSGYLNGLKGTDIPLPGRITAVADVYDALSSQRPYKKPIPHVKCLEIIREERGSHFDPDVVDAFLLRADAILEVRNGSSNESVAAT